MEDLLKQVLSDETLYASAKTLFAYLYVCNRECTKYNHEILSEVNIGINAYFRAVRDLECCGYMKAKFHRSETKKPIFVFGDENSIITLRPSSGFLPDWLNEPYDSPWAFTAGRIGPAASALSSLIFT